MATKADIKRFREEAIKHMVRDIKESDRNEVPPEEIWDNLHLDSYCYYSTEEDKVKAFKKAGFIVEFTK